MTELIILAFSVYGTSKLLTEYDGFMDVFYRLRRQKWLKMLTCTVCTSLWVAVPFTALYLLGFSWVLIPLAITGAIILTEQLS